MMLLGKSDTFGRVGSFLLVADICRVAAQTQCFLPNGSLATGDIPCNSSPGGTDCCPADYQCLPFTQICYKSNPANANELLYARGSCTDQSWGPGCADFCSAGALGSTHLVTMDRCEANPEEYCCVEDSASSSCTCGPDNTINVFEKSNGTSTSSVASTTSTPASPSSTQPSISSTSSHDPSSHNPSGVHGPTSPSEPVTEATPEPQSSPTISSPDSTPTEAAAVHRLTLAQKIGVGIGVSVGTIVVSLGGLALMFLRMKSDPEDPDDDVALNGEHELPDPPSTTNSYQAGSFNSKKAVSPSHWLGTAVEEASRRPFSEASSQYTTDIPYASSTTFVPTHHSSERSGTQWPLSSEFDYPQMPPRARSPAYRSSYDIFANSHRNEI